MQDQLKPINSPDGLFHDGNPYTGELGTVVTSEWLNGMQSAVQSTQQEMLTLLKTSGQNPDPSRKDQLQQAVQNIAWGGNSKPTTLAGYGIAIASQAEAEAGTDNIKAMTPLRVEQALNAAGLSGYAKNIASGSLQTVRPNGLYHVDAGQTSGAPDKSNGMLLANFLNDKWGNQVYWMWGGATYEQRLENGNWQPWVKLLKTGQQSTLADYGITDGASKTDLQTAVNNLVAGAPGALNTLQELAAALGNDQNFAATITNQLANKADKAATLAGYGITDAPTFEYVKRSRGKKLFTTDGTFTVPADVTTIYVSGTGGGGGGSGKATSSDPYGGAGGGGAEAVLAKEIAVKPGTSLTITIGKGGSGGAAGLAGVSGGATSFGDLLTLKGGGGATAAGNTPNAQGGIAGGNGGNSGGDYASSSVPGSGGGTIFGAGGPCGVNGAKGGLYGGGGSGGGNSRFVPDGKGGDGANGFLLVEW
ncbi:glycine-rich domain-containing protein [Chromobacterium violaceum]|uniref:glycine-rich domain-containing protein n=1 Tax=Chromobacterium violaceum TaxID=536 RepID=UPI00143D4EC9|nr:hypothetical protein [Chromobacterium violaceum]QIY79236.1 hypothetical protein FOB43_08570 [Chromobacterium violaceum]